MTTEAQWIIRILAIHGLFWAIVIPITMMNEASCERENQVYDCTYNGHTEAWEPKVAK